MTSRRDERTNPWRTVASRPVYENPWMSVRHDDVLTPAGTEGVYGVMTPRNLAVGVLPLFDNGDTILVGQWRYALGCYSWEIPEGGVPRSESSLEGIARELREETGCAAGCWEPLARDLTLSNSITDERADLWLAWSLTVGEAAPEETEELAIRRLPYGDALDLVLEGTVHDALTVIAFGLVEARRTRGLLPAAVMDLLRQGQR